MIARIDASGREVFADARGKVIEMPGVGLLRDVRRSGRKRGDDLSGHTESVGRTESAARLTTTPGLSQANADEQTCYGTTNGCRNSRESGRRDLNPRPPEPHAAHGGHLKR